jgi:hypothetical protein
MDDESLNLIFGVIFLILIINTTILWSIVSSINGQTPAPQIISGGNAPDFSSPYLPEPVRSQIPSFQPSGNRGAALADPKIIVTNSDHPESAKPAPSQIPSLPSPGNRGAALADPKITVTKTVPSASAKPISSYLSIEMPKQPEIEMRPTLQPNIPQRDFEGFVEIYSLTNQELSQALPRISMKLVNPPLVIDYSISPHNITDVKYIEYKEIETMHKENIIIDRSYEDSWFRVVVRDKDTGEIVEEDGFGRTYSLENQRQLIVRTCGNYSVEFTGEYATIDLTVRIREDGIIP